jgi:hypothetical protein
MTKLRVLVLSFPNFTDISNVCPSLYGYLYCITQICNTQIMRMDGEALTLLKKDIIK